MTDTDFFRPLGFGTTFGRVFQVFRDRWKAFTAISFVWYVMGWFFAILFNLVVGNDISIDGFSSGIAVYQNTMVMVFSGGDDWDSSVASTDDFATNWEDLEATDDFAANWEDPRDVRVYSLVAEIFYLIEVLIYFVFTSVAHGAATWIVAHWYLHQEPSILDAFLVAASKCWTLVGATLLMAVLTLFVIIPVVIFIISASNGDEATTYVLVFLLLVGIWIFSILTYVTYIAVMVEGKGSWYSIKRSFALTKGHFGKIFCIVFVWGIVKFLLGAIVTVVSLFRVGCFWCFGDFWCFGGFLDTVVGIFLLAIAPVFEGVIYMELRSSIEDFGSVKLGEEIGIGENSYITMVPTKTHAKRSLV